MRIFLALCFLLSLLFHNKGEANQQYAEFVRRMDSGNFNFSQEEENFLINLWFTNNSIVPLPSRLKQIYDSRDAFLMNSFEAAELIFKLPYGIAYERAQAQGYKALIDWILQQGITLENKIIIDAGCGFGGLSARIHERFPNSMFFGIECVQAAKERLTRTYPWLTVSITDMQESVTDLIYTLPDLADVVYCIEVLEHLQHPEAVITNLLTLRKDRGVLILTVPNGRVDSTAQHINFWSPESWKVFIEKTCPNYKTQFLKIPNSNAPAGYYLCAIIKEKL